MSFLGVGSLAFGQTFAIDSTLLTPPRRPAPTSRHTRITILSRWHMPSNNQILRNY